MIRPSGTEPELKVYAEVVKPVRSLAELASVRADASGQAERMLATAVAAVESGLGGDQS
jgi:phosphomannomutase